MNKETLQNYNTRLGANNTSLESILNTINNLPEAGSGGSGGGSSLNLFIQPDEPATKEGIWLQTDEELSDKITVTTQTYLADTFFSSWTEYLKGKPTDCVYYPYITRHKGWLYFFGGSSTYNISNSTNKAYRINIESGVVENIKDMPIYGAAGVAISVGDYIYIFGGARYWNTANNSQLVTEAVRYDVINDTYDYITPIPNGLAFSRSVTTGDKIYIIGGTRAYSVSKSNLLYEYDIPTNTITEFKLDWYNYMNPIVMVGDWIYFFGGTNGTSVATSYKYNPMTKETIQISDPPTNSSYYGGAVYHKGVIYIVYGIAKQFVKYDIETDTYTTLSDYPLPSSGATTLLTDVGDRLMLHFSGGSNLRQIMYSDTFDYNGDENTLLMYQRVGLNPYQVALCSSNTINGRLLSSFTDVGYYSTETGINNDIPTYYGNGAEWVKFKG